MRYLLSPLVLILRLSRGLHSEDKYLMPGRGMLFANDQNAGPVHRKFAASAVRRTPRDNHELD